MNNFQHKNTGRAHRLIRSLAVMAVMAVVGLGSVATAQAQTVSFEFTQTNFATGGTIRGLVTGEDLNGDGVLYSMSDFLGDFISQPTGDEVTHITLVIEDFNGETLVQTFDTSITPLNDPTNLFFGLSYNLDGGAFGDEANEGISFGPLAPSTSYTMGALFSPLVSPFPFPDSPLVTCGQPDVGVCGHVVSLVPGDEFPDIEVTFSDFSAGNVVTTQNIVVTFAQDGFAGGGTVRGVLAGQDLDGDGQLYSMGAFASSFLNVPLGDEVSYARAVMTGFDGQNFDIVFDRNVAGIDEQVNAFFGFSYNLDGEVGDDADEGLSFAPLAPSTSYTMGPLFSAAINPVPFPDTPLVACGDPDAGVCATVVSLVPGDEFPDIDVTFSDFSSATVAMTPDPLLVDATYSGAWFDPNRNGEGFLFQTVDSNRVFVTWYTYDNDGNQRWFSGVGNIEGQTIQVDELLITSGGVFGPMFDPDAVVFENAGPLTITFGGCGTATANFTIDDTAGSIDLQRLVGIDTLECFGPQ